MATETTPCPACGEDIEEVVAWIDCEHCGAHLIHADHPANADVYTHADSDFREDADGDQERRTPVMLRIVYLDKTATMKSVDPGLTRRSGGIYAVYLYDAEDTDGTARTDFPGYFLYWHTHNAVTDADMAILDDQGYGDCRLYDMKDSRSYCVRADSVWLPFSRLGRHPGTRNSVAYMEYMADAVTHFRANRHDWRSPQP